MEAAPEEEPVPAPVAAAPAPATAAPSEPPPAPAALEATPAPAAVAPAAAAPAAAPASSRGGSPALVAELKEKLAQQEAAKRFHDYVKTLIALGDAVEEPSERADYYAKAADLYVNKFANQAEAVRAFEKVIEVDPNNRAAIQYLREMYEKRRDWE
jgi:hypothetical protein